VFQYLKDFAYVREYEEPYGQGRNPTKYPKLPKLR